MISGSRIGLLLAAWFYAIVLHFSHIEYLNPAWEYFGFTYRNLNLMEIALIIFLVTSVALVLPIKMTRASSIILLPLFVVVYVPTIVITLGLDENRLQNYGLSLLILGLVFFIACVISNKSKQKLYETEKINVLIQNIFLLGWVIFCAILIYNYSSIMAVAGLDEVYEQRAIGASTSLLIGYIQTYFSNVLSPALIALGLVWRKYWLTLIGTIGCIIMYMITAQRTVFLLPFVMFGLYYLLTSKVYIFRTSAFLITALSVVVMFCSVFYLNNNIAFFLSTYLVFRTLALPGLTFSQYYDVFDIHGFTWWSHVKGFDFLLSPPVFFADHPSWPGLGHVVGDIVYGNFENNVNANLFSSDGLAAAGPIGVLLIGIIFIAWLMLLDRVTNGWNRNFVLLVTLPISLSLTNGSLFTVMLSFGGLLWILIFYFLKPAKRVLKT